jgi:hypothetical protein
MSILDKIKSLFRRRPNLADDPPISAVLLLSKPAVLTEDLLHQAATRAWGRALDPVPIEGTDAALEKAVREGRRR